MQEPCLNSLHKLGNIQDLPGTATCRNWHRTLGLQPAGSNTRSRKGIGVRVGVGLECGAGVVVGQEQD